MTSRRTVLITGGTGSLGFHAAQAILADGGWVTAPPGADSTLGRSPTFAGSPANCRRCMR
jgi:NAD(P)-dependent dehydrogenase (short-subunit alcohol dehydrogenase family)